ncbi:Uma2 family endonuclease [Kitasatospora sp. NPDC057015]|uniref:Uma2 family endonuclease n=1 Tax=Kitasatospora sp. NPDC057015 TaxID=3346001 RepID=UPI0036304801
MTGTPPESAWDEPAVAKPPQGYRVEITDGKVIMTPQGISRWKVILRAAPQIEAQLAGHGDVLSGVPLDFPSARSGYAPDLAVLAPGAVVNARGRYEWHDLEAALDVVPRPDQDEDFVKKLRVYARSGVPLYAVVDPAEAVCTVHSDPQDTGSYRDAERVPFGNDVYLPLGERTLVVRTDEFPAEGAAPTPGA